MDHTRRSKKHFLATIFRGSIFLATLFRGSIFQKDLEEAYEQIVHLHKNLFMLPSGAAGKRFINQINRL